jgi:hypothetical protein
MQGIHIPGCDDWRCTGQCVPDLKPTRKVVRTFDDVDQYDIMLRQWLVGTRLSPPPCGLFTGEEVGWFLYVMDVHNRVTAVKLLGEFGATQLSKVAACDHDAFMARVYEVLGVSQSP